MYISVVQEKYSEVEVDYGTSSATLTPFSCVQSQEKKWQVEVVGAHCPSSEVRGNGSGKYLYVLFCTIERVK